MKKLDINSIDVSNSVVHRAYYSAECCDFLITKEAEIHDTIVQNSMQFDLTAKQNIAWNEEIRILKHVMKCLGSGHIAFEYTIPRMGKRVDVADCFLVVYCPEQSDGATPSGFVRTMGKTKKQPLRIAFW